MIQKFPKKINKKWQRFNKLEKLFIIYTVLIPFLMFFLPIIKKVDLNWQKVWSTTIFNKFFFTLDIFIIILITTLILWNTSYRFRKLVYLLVWFKENESLVNFAILFNLTIIMLTIWVLVKLLNNLFIETIKLDFWFYIISIYLVIGLIINLVLSLNFSTKRKKANLVNIISPQYETSTEEKIKQEVLFK